MSPSSVDIKLAAAKKAHWYILWWAFVIGAALAFVAVVWPIIQMVRYNRKEKDETKKFHRNTPLTYLGTSWSFKDNWVGNVTIGSAALVALLASSDVLTAILGSKPEAALGLLAVASALAAVFVAIGPLLLKAIGPTSSIPTVKGMLVAGFVTLTGALGQVTAVTWQGAELVSGDHFHVKEVAVCLLGSAIVTVVIWYAAGALWELAESGSTKPPRSETALAADDIVRAIRGLPPRPGAGPEEAGEIPVSPQGNALL